MKFNHIFSALTVQDILSDTISKSVGPSDTMLSFSNTWDVLGPFQIGTREATWGADPLEFHGGFRSLHYDPDALFSSSLATNATVRWSKVDLTSQDCTDRTAKAVFNVGFPDIEWSSLQSIYGWTALQYQAWARGTLIVNGTTTQTITLWTERILEFSIDGTHHFGGDFYGYETVPLVLHLEPGSHTIDLRLIRDVRSMGGTGTPTIDVSITAKVSTNGLVHASDTALLPDIVDGRLAGALGSVIVRNDDLEDAYVTGVSINDTAYFAWLAQPSSIRIVPGQTRPIAFVISCKNECPADVEIDVEYSSGDRTFSLGFVQTIAKKAITDPHRITFLNPGGMVSYAILRPPNQTAPCSTGLDNTLPVLLQLHGAGVDASNDIVRHAFDPVPNLCAWGLYPTGSTAWSGDDWHTWGFADVEAAIASLPVWLETVGWKGPGVDTERWLVVGHSNGGQGTWSTLTHRPDNVIAAAPISGYSSIQNYVPYHFWSPMDQAVQAILETSLGNFKHERLLANAQGIPVLQQHGGADDNVPVYHSRLMRQLLDQAGTRPSYFELEGKNHWFDGIMTTEPLKAFYEQQLGVAKETMVPPFDFDFVVANPAAMGPKHGISVLHLSRQGQLGRVEVTFDAEKPACSIRTTNILSLRLPAMYTRTRDIIIDGQEIGLAAMHDGVHLWLASNGSWEMCTSGESPALRKGRQLGSMDAFLRTENGIDVVRSSRNKAVERIALQVSRNLCQYFGSDTTIIDAASSYMPEYSNAVRVAVGDDVPSSFLEDFPIQVNKQGVVDLRNAAGQTKSYHSRAALGVIMLRPLKDEQVELLIWGSDEEGLAIAARLMPMLTGVGQPDFVIADRRMMWGGAGQVLAMGYFDHLWNVTIDSYLT